MGTAVGVMVVIVAAASSPDEIRDAVDSVYDDSGLQRQLPAPSIERAEAPAPAPSGLGSLARILLWVGLGAVVLLAIVWVVSELVLGPRAPPPVADELEVAGAERAPPAELRGPRADAEALAAAGRYAEAVHALLFQTLAELVRAGARTIPPALTAREICRRVEMPEAARTELAALVSAVEVSHFGGRPPDAGDYAACRQRFDRFVASYRRRG